MIRAKLRDKRANGCVCLADQYERFGHRDYCEEQTQLSKFGKSGV